MDADLEQKVRQWGPCQENRKSPPEAPLHPWERLHQPWVHLHLDYAGPFLGKMFLIVIDAHSKWIEAFPMNTSTSSTTIEKLRITFVTHGLPEIVVTENGCNFITRKFEDFLKQNGICHIRTAPYHPASNGMAESSPNIQGGNEEDKWRKCGDAHFKFSCSLQIHRSDFNRNFTGRTASRKETQIESGPSLPRNWKESATKSGLSETDTWLAC